MAPAKQPASAPGAAEHLVSTAVSLASRSSTHSGWRRRSGLSTRAYSWGFHTAGAAKTRATAKPTHRSGAGIGPPSASRDPAAVAPSAATRTRPSSPRHRSSSTTVAAIVFEPMAAAVSVTRTTSPPILLGRKLLKNVATRKEEVSDLKGSRTFWAARRIRHRQVAVATINPYSASAASSQDDDAWRAAAQRRPTSSREKSSARRPRLITVLRQADR